MSITEEEVTPCYLCHKDMYQAVKLFDHVAHQELHEKEGNCKTCHVRERTLHTFTPCKNCHGTMAPQKFTLTPVRFQTPAYMDAMHTLCIDCHTKEWEKTGRPTPDYCNTCHKGMEGDIWKEKYAVPQVVVAIPDTSEDDTSAISESPADSITEKEENL